MPVRSAKAQWEGNLTEGKGKMALNSGAFEGQYSFSSRFEEGKGTNPEELIAAAHAGCFSMAFSAVLGEAQLKPERIETKATVTMEKTEPGWTLTKIHLDVTAKVPGADAAAVQAAAEKAKAGCPISRVLKSEITLSVRAV